LQSYDSTYPNKLAFSNNICRRLFPRRGREAVGGRGRRVMRDKRAKLAQIGF